MKILGFDTATNLCSVALLVDGVVIARAEEAPRRHSELLLPMIDALLIAQNLTVSALDAISFGVGPGSFMGVRLATGVAQGLSFAAKLPVIPVSTLQILAQTAYRQHNVTTALAGWDARMQQIYWGCYQLVDGVMQPVLADQLSDPEAIACAHPGCNAVGNAWQVYRQQLPTAIQSLPSHTELYPFAEDLLTIASKKFQDQDWQQATDVEPSYLRDRVAG